jgi:uncharacterized protein YhaN
LSEIREKERRLVELDRLFEALGEERESLLEMDQECAAITMAAQRIETLSGQLYEEQGDQFAVRVSALLSSLTGGAYDRIAIDDRMEVHVNTPDHLLKVSQVSYGTMEQIYFALRLSAGKLLASGTVPVLLDEPFAMYDDERLEAALRYLRTCGRQVILFTCQRRELEILSEIEAG